VTTEGRQVPTDELVVRLAELQPARVVHARRQIGRAHDAGERHRGQHAIRAGALAKALQELLDLTELSG